MAPNTTAPQVYQPATQRDPKVVRLEGIVRGHRIARQLELDSIGRMIAAARDIANVRSDPEILQAIQLRKK